MKAETGRWEAAAEELAAAGPDCGSVEGWLEHWTGRIRSESFTFAEPVPAAAIPEEVIRRAWELRKAGAKRKASPWKIRCVEAVVSGEGTERRVLTFSAQRLRTGPAEKLPSPPYFLPTVLIRNESGKELRVNRSDFEGPDGERAPQWREWSEVSRSEPPEEISIRSFNARAAGRVEPPEPETRQWREVSRGAIEVWCAGGKWRARVTTPAEMPWSRFVSPELRDFASAVRRLEFGRLCKENAGVPVTVPLWQRLTPRQGRPPAPPMADPLTADLVPSIRPNRRDADKAFVGALRQKAMGDPWATERLGDASAIGAREAGRDWDFATGGEDLSTAGLVEVRRAVERCAVDAGGVPAVAAIHKRLFPRDFEKPRPRPWKPGAEQARILHADKLKTLKKANRKALKRILLRLGLGWLDG
ncbi:MAG TPA: hypothetical protein VMN36_00600 [Verrucomicrobiales bacterium]|nr:hypothetical protein [Verrucomicrobiales bacterium]